MPYGCFLSFNCEILPASAQMEPRSAIQQAQRFIRDSEIEDGKSINLV
jgi:hypothetical protein